MAERRVKVPIPPDNRLVDAVEVGVAESTERWSEFTLEDGTVIRAKLLVVGFNRVEGLYDNDGNPLYGIKAGTSHLIVSCPEHLRKKLQ